MSRVYSPKYPNYSLAEAVDYVSKIYAADRNYPVDREVVAKHMGYSGLSGASDKAIATLMQYGLLERVAKGEVRVSGLAVDILHPDHPDQKREALHMAAFSPPLFRAIRERFPSEQPSETNLRSWLLREGFNDRAINPVIKAYSQTYSFLRQENAIESGGAGRRKDADSQTSEGQNGGQYGGAKVGDLVQWESQGALQFPKPLRVRMVSDDGQWLAVEGSQTGIPMNEVIVESAAQQEGNGRKAPMFPLDTGDGILPERNEVEWMRNRLGHDTNVRLLVKGDIGPREIGKLIKLLKAQKAVLEDDDSDDYDASNPDEQLKRDFP